VSVMTVDRGLNEIEDYFSLIGSNGTVLTAYPKDTRNHGSSSCMLFAYYYVHPLPHAWY